MRPIYERPFGKNALTFSDVVKQLRTTFETFSDRRTGKNTNYTMTDAGLSAFSVFFMQSPCGTGFITHTRQLKKTTRVRRNAAAVPPNDGGSPDGTKRDGGLQPRHSRFVNRRGLQTFRSGSQTPTGQEVQNIKAINLQN